MLNPFWRMTVQGLLLINKPEGITSFSAVSKIKWLLHQKRVGHTGTLDPMATGVLPLLFGNATKAQSLLPDRPFVYEIIIAPEWKLYQ